MPRISQNLQDVKEEDMNHEGGWRSLLEGDYRFVVTETDYKSTKNGKGMVLWVRVQCIEPGHQSSKWTEFFTIEHSNPDTVRIARAKLKALAIAVGHSNPDYVEYSEDLHDRPFMAHVIQEISSDPKYGDAEGYQNRIGGFAPIAGGAPAYSSRPQRTAEEINADDIPF